MKRVAVPVAAGATAAALAWWVAAEPAARPTPAARCPLGAPVGPPDGAGYYIAQRFGENDHLGEDWNGNGGGDTDLGDPVVAVGEGVVTEVADHGGGWGNVVRIAHPCSVGPGSLVESLYAHLDTIDVVVGAPVARGQRIGTIGNAGGQYPAHLHLELRALPGLPLGGGYAGATERAGYLDPAAFRR